MATRRFGATSVFHEYMTVMAVFIACSGPASGAQVGRTPATLPGLRSATVAETKPPNDSPHTMIFLGLAIPPEFTYLISSSSASTASGADQP